MSDAKKKIAIIEDDASIVEMYKTKLEHDGFEVQVANDGLVGLELIKSFRPDLVLLDILMPNMSGIEMIEKLRAFPEGKDVKVIVMTNLEDEETTSRMYRTGPVQYIVKASMTPTQVVDEIRRALGTLPPLKPEINPDRHRGK
jgi:two-component system alkaline phosphatase synthesis response regulator PhoP